MNDKFIELAKRAIACRNWKWMPGMLDTDGRRYKHPAEDTASLYYEGPHVEWPSGGNDPVAGLALPDLRDPATLGCLLALVREAFPFDPATTSRQSSWERGRGNYYVWLVSFCTGGDWKHARGPTEAAALVAALEAAP